jgi:hypothetical protein
VLQQTEQPTSVITILSPNSSKATRQRSLPFVLRQCIFYNQSCPALAGFSLIGITAESALVHIGDTVEEQVDRGDYAQPLNFRASHSSHPTLWQDIFGKSALFSGAGHVERLRNPAGNRGSGKMGWDILTEGGPSHLIPAAGVLFEPLIESLLGMSERHDIGHNRDQKKGLRGDVEMEDVQEGPLSRKVTRDVSDREINMLVELFKNAEFPGELSSCSDSSTIDPPSPKASSQATLNTKRTTNGPQKPLGGKPNGIHLELTPQSAPPSPVITITNKYTKSNGTMAVPSPVISGMEVFSGPPIKAGKKRKSRQ